MTEKRTEYKVPVDIEAIEDLLSAIPDIIITGTNDEGAYVALVALYVQAPRLLAGLVAEVRRLRAALERIEAWDFDIMGDCVADAQELAQKALGGSSND